MVELKEDKLVVPADKSTANKKVKVELEVDTSDDGVYSAGCTTITFADGVALQGDFIDIWCDGSKYYVSGQTKADGGISVA